MHQSTELSFEDAPKKLENIGGEYCYANALVQCLFNNEVIWSTISNMLDSEKLKQIASHYSTNRSSGYHAINLKQYFDDFPPIQIIKQRNTWFLHQDPQEFHLELCRTYPSILKPFRVSGQDDTANILISDFYGSVQNGLDVRLSDDANINLIPEILAISIERVHIRDEKAFLSMAKMKINRYICFRPCKINEGEEIEQIYELQSFIIHKNVNPDGGHFVSILNRGDSQWMCDDKRVLPYIENKISDVTLDKKCYLLYYKKIGFRPENLEELFEPKRQSLERNIDSPKDLNENTKCNGDRKSESNSDVSPNSSKKTQELFIPYTGSSGGKEIPDDLHIDPDHIGRFKLKQHSEKHRFDLHSEFKKIHGFLDIEKGETPQCDYESDPCSYSHTSSLLELFVKILCKFNYHAVNDNSEINADLTMKALGEKKRKCYRITSH